MSKNGYAAVCTALKGPSAISIQVQLVRDPIGTEVLIRIRAASLNFPDVLMTYGKYQFRPELPFILGMEGAGDVVAAGPDVADLKPGDSVMFQGKTGAFAEYGLFDATRVSRMPRSLSFEEGAAFAVTFSTAYVSLTRRGKIQSGEALLITGAGGGVGQACVAVGKALGAVVIAAASSAEKLAIAEESGADHVINYDAEDLTSRVLEITDGRGVDVILDPVGGEVLDQAVSCLAWHGRLLVVGFASGGFGNPDLAKLQSKGGEIIGVRAGEYGRKNPVDGKQAFVELLTLTDDKLLKPAIGGVWALQEVPDALRAMETRRVSGKQVIKLAEG